MDRNKSPLVHQEYISRINLVQDYIEKNINTVITLDDLSTISGFSKYHFHRIFGSIMNETLYHYINRLKLEKAASYLLHAPHKTITDIALDLCFANSAMFARSFKKRYGMSATEYRLTYSKKRQTESKNRKVPNVPAGYNKDDKTNDWRHNKMKMECKVDVVDCEEMTVIYLRHVGAYSEFGKVFQNMLGRLITWASAKGIVNHGGIKLLTIYHDNHEITNEDRLRTSVCMAVPKDTTVDGEFGKMSIPAGKYAIGHFSINNGEQHGHAWRYLYGEWLPNSGYQPDDGASFEKYLNDPNTHPEKKHLIDIYLPVKPL
ncbi:AraC family transcriptional regulator [Chengkuizengella axinellae]|uniref:AraC family transcriptional regulator n=1 Tax=Chengkuizengella axinellae TaxID=3064388 RepID=A0ABT9IY17_9BACL|nr:AraC family transcriptional regulator [Chengkuizengella sp. 2205SS18-9]MDP5274255.1 AraC family transcriptional regulator [Chengkuizengella sp. 2205SS18-9]